MAKKARVTVCPDYKIAKVEDRLYGAFLEPIGNWVYGGIYNPNHPAADEMGFRKDILEAVREFGMPAIRLPGGNFVSGWDWRDSIGPKAQRKGHLDLAWRQYEPNTIGHDEYLEWARRAGVETMYTLNMGTADISSAIECIEYSNHPGGTYWSDLRKKNGHDEPYGIKTWYLGNEADGPWQIRSWEKDPTGYGIKVHETSKAMKWVDPSIQTIVCGTSTPYNHTYPQWDVDVLEQCYETVDMVSLHYYHGAPEGSMAGYLNGSTVFEEFIKTELAACDLVKAKLRDPKTMMISFDEYGCAFQPQGRTVTGRAGRIPHDAYHEFSEQNMNRPFRFNDPDGPTPEFARRRYGVEMLSALTMASILMTFIRHADRVKIGCMTGGVRGAIAFDNEHVWKSGIYYPYYQLSKYGRGTSVLPVVDGPVFSAEGYNVSEFTQNAPYENIQSIEAATVMDEEKEEVNIFLVNRDWEAAIEIDLDVRGFEGYRLVEHIEMFAEDLDLRNAYDQPDNLKPSQNHDTKMDGGKVSLMAKSLSWNVIRLAKK